MKLIADKLSVLRDSRPIFTGLSFALEAGSSLILRGPNGAGKTTLLRVIAGLLPASAGRLRVEGGPAEGSVSELCHYVGHLNAIKPNLTVEENARFWQRFLGAGGQHVAQALAAFGLAGLGDIPAAYLSAGQKRRLALARVLLTPRAIWLLDEPAAALDQDAEAALSAAVTARLAGGGLVIAATHQPLNWPHARVLRLGPSARVA
jgi:heme exporter protein A